jgi:hypothetical protein
MSYTLALQCGCVVYVSQHPDTGLAHTRIIEARGRNCRRREHMVGKRLFLWELLPEPTSAYSLVSPDSEPLLSVEATSRNGE